MKLPKANGSNHREGAIMEHWLQCKNIYVHLTATLFDAAAPSFMEAIGALRLYHIRFRQDKLLEHRCIREPFEILRDYTREQVSDLWSPMLKFHTSS